MQNKQHKYTNTRTSKQNCTRTTQPSGVTNRKECVCHVGHLPRITKGSILWQWLYSDGPFCINQVQRANALDLLSFMQRYCVWKRALVLYCSRDRLSYVGTWTVPVGKCILPFDTTQCKILQTSSNKLHFNEFRWAMRWPTNSTPCMEHQGQQRASQMASAHTQYTYFLFYAQKDPSGRFSSDFSGTVLCRFHISPFMLCPAYLILFDLITLRIFSEQYKWWSSSWPWDSSFNIVTRYGLDGPGIESRWEARFYAPVQTVPGPTHPPTQWVPGLFLGSGVDTHIHLVPRLQKG